MQCSRGSKSLGSVLVALWGNGNAASVLKCHEMGEILCVYAMVENLQTHERGNVCVRGLSDRRSTKVIPSARQSAPDDSSLLSSPLSHFTTVLRC